MPPTISVMKKPKDAKGTLRRLVDYLADYRWPLLGVAALSVTANVLALLGPSLAGSAINEAAAGAGQVNFDRVFYFAKWMLVCYVASSLLTIAINVAMMYISRWIARKMRKDVFDKLMRIPVGYFDRNQAGDIISRVSYDIDVVCTCISTDVVSILTSTVTVIGSFCMMLYISPALSAVVIVTIPVSVAYTVYMRGKTQPRYSRRSASYGAMNGFVEEMFSGQKTIQAYAYEEQVRDNFAGVNADAADAYYQADYYGTTIGPTMGSINNLSLSLIAMLGAVLYMTGGVSLGQISSFVLYSRKFSGPINEIANIINELFSALSAAERVFRLLDEAEETADRETAKELADVRGGRGPGTRQLRLRPGPHHPPRRELAGGRGQAHRHRRPHRGGQDHHHQPADAVLRRGRRKNHRGRRRDPGLHPLQPPGGGYAMVLQDTWVFHGTIFDNIAYGKEGATQEEVEAAARAAHIHPFIMRLPQGYQTVISEDGGNISKGQKQLLTIARAMLYDCKMLILDEAASNVDTSTEREIQAAMRQLMQDKTCFVIAHRLSTIQNADQILVVNHGDVVEQGTHESLMRQGGFYCKLYNAQFE